ncbi:DUF748 domain-containing protein [Methylomonas sp. AM2-LC]|uniref:DUF748 domain-containing protein n=1 Tax=Methylomonas sp. AM2-LC TaxID=3153301 RepID=UPI0032661D77
MVITKKQKIVATIVVTTFVFYAGLGFYFLPLLVVKKLPEILLEQTGQTAELQAFKFNPFSFELEMDGFSLASPAGNSLVSFEVFAINFNVLDTLWHQAATFDSIILSKPIINIKREADRRFNFSGMFPKSESQPESNEKSVPPSLNIHHLAIETAEISWMDVSKGFPQNAELKPINFEVNELTTEINGKGNFDLGFELASGGRLQWHGDLSLEPLSSTGLISLEQLKLEPIWKGFLQDLIPIVISEGSLTAHVDYQTKQVDGKPELLISNGVIDVNKLVVTEKNGNAPLLTIPTLAVREITLDLDKKKIRAAVLESKDAQIKAALEADGRLNYQRLFVNDQSSVTSPPTAKTASTQVTTRQPEWQISLDEVALNNYQFLFTDLTRKTPQLTQLSNTNFKLQKLTVPQIEKLPMQFSALLNNDGKLKLDGDLQLSPFNAVLSVDVQNIKLPFLQTYVDDYLNLELVDGEFNTSGNLQINADDAFQLLFKGDADIANLLTRDKLNHKDFLKWSDLSLQQIDIDLAQQTFSLGKVLFDHPYLRVTIQKDRTTNFNDIVVTQPVAKSTPTKPKSSDTPKTNTIQTSPIINIGKIELEAGYSDFSDYSLIMPFVTEMDELNGVVDGFASNQNKPLSINLKGKVYHLALVNIKGKYQLQSGDSNITLKFDHMPLPLITPYMADFAGYKIEKGQMALDLQYTINQGQLDAKNKIFIDQLTLGDQVENPHATSLPLNLAIALLKDADGKINLDFPVTGSLNDPQFSIGSLIADVFSNLITKLVSSPFRALGGLLSEDQDYSSVKFPAGSAEIQAAEMQKLDQLSKALQNKPGLSLDIKGKSYPSLDWPVIRSDALKEILKKMKSGELRDKGTNIRSEYIELSDEEYKRLLEKFFHEVYPQELDHSLFGKPRIKTLPDVDFYEVAKQKLEDKLQPEPERLNNLAIARANAISKYLLDKDGIDLNRQYILAPEINAADTTDIVSVLSLNVAH